MISKEEVQLINKLEERQQTTKTRAEGKGKIKLEELLGQKI
jgi:hypothetical protein